MLVSGCSVGFGCRPWTLGHPEAAAGPLWPCVASPSVRALEREEHVGRRSPSSGSASASRDPTHALGPGFCFSMQDPYRTPVPDPLRAPWPSIVPAPPELIFRLPLPIFPWPPLAFSRSPQAWRTLHAHTFASITFLHDLPLSDRRVLAIALRNVFTVVRMASTSSQIVSLVFLVGLQSFTFLQRRT